MVSVCLPSDALLKHLPSYLGFSYLGHGVSLHGCSSKAQPLLLNLDEGYLLTATLPDLQCGIAPLGPPAPAQPRLRVTPLVAAPGLGCGLLLPATAPYNLACPKTEDSWFWNIGYENYALQYKETCVLYNKNRASIIFLFNVFFNLLTLKLEHCI